MKNIQDAQNKLDTQIIGDRIMSVLPYKYQSEEGCEIFFKTMNLDNYRIVTKAKNNNTVPPISDLLAIAKCFNVSMDYLLGRTAVPAIAQPCASRIDSAIKTIAEYTEQSYDDVCEQLGISEDEIMNY